MDEFSQRRLRIELEHMDTLRLFELMVHLEETAPNDERLPIVKGVLNSRLPLKGDEDDKDNGGD